jgi:uncharacterized membrane protein YdbT with pleckstrin-like domain
MKEMDRIFHAKVNLYKLLFIALLTLLAVWALWEKQPLWGALLLVWLVAVIEQVIHTTYTLTTDGRLVISRGRFSKEKQLPLSRLRRVEKIRPLRLGSHALLTYLLLVYTDESGTHEKSLSVQPVKEDEFLELLEKKASKKDTNP